jgi:hypothetical protein
MRDIAHLVALTQPDDALEVVLDDAEVVAVIVDVGRQEQRIPPAHDALLAQVGSVPVDFQPQLVRLHDLWRLGKPCAELREKSQIAVRCRLVIDESRVGELAGAPFRRTLHQRTRARIIPWLLRLDGHRGEKSGDGDDEWASARRGRFAGRLHEGE